MCAYRVSRKSIDQSMSVNIYVRGYTDGQTDGHRHARGTLFLQNPNELYFSMLAETTQHRPKHN